VICGRIACWARQDNVRWTFGLFDQIINRDSQLEDWEQIKIMAQPWFSLQGSIARPTDFAKAVGLAGTRSRTRPPSES
jgi:hypothetical protein